MKKIIVLGSGGHAKVVIDTLQQLNKDIIGIATLSNESSFMGIPIIGKDDDVLRYSPNEILLVNGIGSIGNMGLRKKVFLKFKNKGYFFYTMIHPSAILSPTVTLGEGVQIMAGSVVQTDVQIGDNVLLNTRTSIDHECQIGGHSHIAPGCTISGQVLVEEEVHLGTGTTVIQQINIGKGVLAGAGSVIIQDIPSYQKVYGVPAKVIM